MTITRSQYVRFIIALGFATLVSLGLFAADAIYNRSLLYHYLPWNLFLAWLPLGLAAWLVRCLRHKLWSSWEALLVSVVWLAFLPNSFYMISDFIHLQEVDPGQILFSVVMFTSFIYTGVLLGFSSLYLVHLELRKRFSRLGAAAWIGLTLLLCSVAMYIGRDLRWNSWDLVSNPAGLLFDVSDRVLHPDAGQLVAVIIPFFVLLSSMYAVVWRSARLLTHGARHH